ncbi:MAG: D-glucuronyl C5-epimerase family protein [bacterium]
MISDYFIDLGFKDVREGMYELFRFDEYGIPLYHYSWGDCYNPVFICHWGLYNLYLFKTQQQQIHLDNFIKAVKWLEISGVQDERGLCYEFKFPLTKYKIDFPWISAMGQGRAVSVLTRAYQLTQDKLYLDMAHQALQPFFIDASQGGVQSEIVKGYIWLEEYPCSPPSHVLNGFIISLMGLYDILVVDPRVKLKKLYDQLIQSLVHNLPRYDCGYWSYYNLYKYRDLANVDYHKYHILLLWKMYELTENKIFWEYSLKWERYLNKPINRALRHTTRIRQRLFKY